MNQYTKDQKAFFDFRIQDNSGNYVFPDWDNTLYVEFYDGDDTLKFTATIYSNPPIQKGTDSQGAYLYIANIDISNYSLGTTTARIYANYNGEAIIPYPTIIDAFEVVEGEAVQVSKYISLGSPIEVLHSLVDDDGNPLLGLTHDEVEAMYITGNGMLHTKYLKSDVFQEKGAGIYGITYSPSEVTSTGIFVSIARPVLYKTISIEILGVVVPTNTCAVTAQFLNVDGSPEAWSPITIINRDFGRIVDQNFIMGEKKVYYSGIDGTVIFPLIPDSLVEIVTKKNSAIVRVPTDQEVISLVDLLDLAIDNYQPIDLTNE